MAAPVPGTRPMSGAGEAKETYFFKILIGLQTF
nr:MAG TPA: hypothetical protein [Caudoviricetes sp.]